MILRPQSGQFSLVKYNPETLNVLKISQKMVIPEHQDGKKDDSLIAFKKITDVVENSRQAGGQQSDAAIIPRIIVDMREFRSDLPCLIHRRGIQVVPVTITVNIATIHNLFTFIEIYSH